LDENGERGFILCLVVLCFGFIAIAMYLFRF